MYCTKCGQEVSELDVYCPHCSGKVNQESSDEGLLDFDDLKNEQNIDDISNIVIKEDIEENNIDKEYEQYKENVFNKNNINSFDYDDLDEFEDEEKGVLNKVLMILIVVAFITAIALAAKVMFFNQDTFPISSDNIEEQSGNEEQNSQNDEASSDKEQEQNQDNQILNRDKIFNNLVSINTNINLIKDSSDLKYNPSTQYKIQDIKQSVPLDENGYKEIEGQKIYYEEAIIRALVQFNSKWIDYVNNNDQAVISLTKKESKAYKNVVNFSRDNKLQEFLLFEIGEIRKGEEGYYVWTHEKIKEIQNGESKIKEYNWIYMLEEGDYDFFISNYYK